MLARLCRLSAAVCACSLILVLQPTATAAAGSSSAKGADAVETETVVLETASGRHSFKVEIATTNAERAQGLMYRRSLPPDAGMLFLYDQPQPLFMWMKNTMIPLDMIFFTAEGEVHRIESNTEPFSQTPIRSEGEVLGVLELNAGKAAEIGLKVGDRLDYPGLGGEQPR